MKYKKIAFFVEGYTEQEFVRKLLTEIFGVRKLAIEITRIKGGKKIPITHTIIESALTTDDTIYYILIYNCTGDSNVKSYILDHRESLIKSGYIKIIGLRDIYPDFKREDIFKLEQWLNYGLPQKDLPIKIVLSIMEIESWFLAEEKHYLKINETLDLNYICNNFNFNPSEDDTQLIDEAAKKLDQIYQNVGEVYNKDIDKINKTINALDYANVYFVVSNRISSLKKLIFEFEEVLN
jgi:hypothetical protein